MGEFLDRLRIAHELDGEARDGVDPHVKEMERLMRKWSQQTE